MSEDGLAAGRTVVANATVAADYGVFAAHIVIEGERVAALTTDDDVLRDADAVIDASGAIVLPGAIDPHAHFEDPGHTEREDFRPARCQLRQAASPP